jgi:hypothetical protein
MFPDAGRCESAKDEFICWEAEMIGDPFFIAETDEKSDGARVTVYGGPCPAATLNSSINTALGGLG